MEAIDALFQGSHEREAFAKGTATRILNFLRELEIDTAAKLTARIEAMSQRDKANFIRNRTRGQYSTERLQRLLVSIQELSAEWRQITEVEIGKSAREIAAAEIALQAQTLELVGVVGEGVSLNAVVSAAYAQPLLAQPLRQYFTEQQAGVKRAITRSLQRSFVAGETVDQTVKSLLNTSVFARRQGEDLRKQRNAVRMLARTGLNHIATVTTRETFKALNVEYWIFLSVLDGRTSTVCKGLSRTRWKVTNDSAPWPPRHPNCRSTPIWGDEEIEGGTQSSNMANGPTPVSAELSYEELMRRQPIAWQRQQFSARQWQLYNEGNVPLRGLSDTKMTRELTDGELEIRYSEILGRLNGADRQAA